MKCEYYAPEIGIIMIDTEQCIMIGSNVPGFEPGTDMDELSY